MQRKKIFRSNIQGRDGNPNTIAIRRVAKLEERVPSPSKSLQRFGWCRHTALFSEGNKRCTKIPKQEIKEETLKNLEKCKQEYIIEERGEHRTSVPSLRKVLWGQLGANTSESACGLLANRIAYTCGPAGRPACTYVQLNYASHTLYLTSEFCEVEADYLGHWATSLLYTSRWEAILTRQREHQRVDEAAITRLRSETLGSPNSSW